MSTDVRRLATFEVAANQEAARRVAEAAATQSATLSLAGLRFSMLPKGLAGLVGLRELDLSGCRRLAHFEPLAALDDLQVLDLSECTRLERLEPIAPLRRLRTLRLTQCDRVHDLSPLASLDELRSLSLRLCTGIRELSPLAALERLQSLNLSGCEALYDATPLEPLRELRGLSLRDWWGLRDLRPLASLTRLETLNLSRCGNLRDLKPLAGLEQLRSLNLLVCRALSDVGPLASLTGLRCIDLCWCDSLYDVDALESLVGLEDLCLSGNGELPNLKPVTASRALRKLELGGRQLQDLRFLESLPELQSLDLGDCKGLRDFTPVASLTRLRHLELSGCEELRDLKPLETLGELESLDLSNCKLHDFEPLSSLPNLRNLNLRGCSGLRDLRALVPLTELQTLGLGSCDDVSDLRPLESLLALEELTLSGCAKVRDLRPLASLSQLNYLALTGCTGIHDISPLTSLKQLRTLHVNGCIELTDIGPLASLAALEDIRLDACAGVTDLSPLHDLRQLETVGLTGITLDCMPGHGLLSAGSRLTKLIANRLAAAPPELGSTTPYDSCLERLEQWQTDLADSGAVPNSEIKVLVLGNGGVGKTQICRRLRGEDYDASVPSTHGIRLGRVEVTPARAAEPATIASVWDFGGQDIYLGTHAMFLDERAVYVIAWSPSHENDDETVEAGVPMRHRRLGYWLEYVRSLAGNAAPVIVVQSRCDSEADVHEPPVPAEHGLLRLQRTSCSALNGELDRLWPELRAAVRFLRQRYAQVLLPAGWVSVSDALRAMAPRRTIARTEFDHLCTAVHGASVPAVVLNFLHRSGRVFWRERSFGGAVVLDQAWALEGVYAVLNRSGPLQVIRERRGLFSAEMLALLVWDAAGYTTTDQELFLSMMEQCGTCFKVAEREYIAPELLPSPAQAQARIAATWRGAQPDARARLRYDFLHEGLWRAVLCAVGKRAGIDAVFWREGVCFHDLESQTTVRIWRELDGDDVLRQGGIIGIETAGQAALPLAHHLVASIAQVQFGQITAVVNWDIGAGPSEANAVEPFAHVPLATPRRPDHERPQVCMSYAWSGESESLVDGLEGALTGAGFQVCRDRSTMRPGDWIADFMEKVGLGQCVIVVVNARYLASPFCMRELLHLYNASLGNRHRMLDKIVPLILTDARIESTLDRLAVVRFWKDQREALERATVGLDPRSWGDSTRDELLLLGDFEHRVADILSWLAGVLMPRHVDAIVADGYAAVIEQVRRRAAVNAAR